MESPVLSFFKDGRLVKSYNMNDFCDSEPERYFCPQEYKWHDTFNVNLESNTMTLDSCGNYYRINLLTGEREKPFFKNYIKFFSFGLIKWE